MKTTTIGTGRLTWASAERRTDRYGAVALMVDGDSTTETGDWVPLNLSPLGSTGILVATVLETRDSTHIGDLYRGIFPSTPRVGERVELGAGPLFREFLAGEDNASMVGVYPDDGRSSDWLDPHALYRVHEQTVRLDFVEA